MFRVVDGDLLEAFHQGMVTAIGHPVTQEGPWLRSPVTEVLLTAYPDAFASFVQAQQTDLPVGSILPVRVVDGRYLVHLIVQEHLDPRPYGFDVSGLRRSMCAFGVFSSTTS
jgi:hypothetical protein